MVDWPLVLGALFFGGLLLLAVYGPLVATHDLYFSRALVAGQGPPFPPSTEFPLGSDAIGRDRLSWLLIGARGSIAIALSAAAIRVIIGGSLGVVAGFRGGGVSIALRRIALGLSSVPATIATLLAVIALGVDVLSFILAVGLVGWAEPFHQARRYARSESARPFVEAARSIGMSEPRLLVRHLLPNLAPQMLTTAAFQVSAVLLLTAELALLNIFVGGAVVVDYDSRGNAIVAPRVANWASMLASTRPIVSLFGDTASVLLPGGALLLGVLAINLFGDALAARAQRFDLYRLFSRRQIAATALVAAAVTGSVLLWPSRLATELAYARDFPTEAATALTRALADLGSPITGSTQADAALRAIAQRLGGQLAQTDETVARATRVDFTIGTEALVAEALSLDGADARGRLVYADTQSLLTNRPPELVSGAIVLLTQVSGSVLPRLAAAGALAVVALDATTTLPHSAGTYPLPVVATTRGALTTALGRALPDLRSSTVRVQLLAEEAAVHVDVARATVRVKDAFARIDMGNAPLVVLAARYDVASPSAGRWGAASASALLVTVVEYLRAQPLSLSVLALATGADDLDFAGLRLGLEQLSAAERDRVVAVLVVGPALADGLLVEAQVVPGLPSGTGRLAARVQDALGARFKSQSVADLVRAIARSRVSAAPLTFSAPGPDESPSARYVERVAVGILTALAYIPRHLDELR